MHRSLQFFRFDSTAFALNGSHDPSRMRRSLWLLFTILAGTGGVVGCGDLIPPRPPVVQPQSADSADAAPNPANTGAANTNPATTGAAAGTTSGDASLGEYEGNWDAWYVRRLGKNVVGVNHIRAEGVLDETFLSDAPRRLMYEQDERLLLRAERVQWVRHVQITSDETSDGNLREVNARLENGPVVTEVTATRNKGKLSVRFSGAMAESSTSLTWPDEAWGLFGIEQSLRRSRIEKGEVRQMSLLLPTFDAIGVVQLKCPGQASVAMLDGTYRVLREVEATFFNGGQAFDSVVYWLDEDGGIVKSLRPASRLESFRTERSQAEQLFGQRDDSAVYVHVGGRLQPDHVPDEVTFRVTSSAEAGGTKDAFSPPSLANQSVRETAAGMHVTIRGPAATGEETQVGESATPADTRATALLDFESPAVRRMADAIDGPSLEETARELADSLRNRLAFQRQIGLRSASLILRAGSGGDMDHAVALAALLRGRGIPSRLVFGLAPIEKQRGDWNAAPDSDDGQTLLKLSAWVVMQIDDRWVSLDPMTARANRADLLALKIPAGDADLTAELNDLVRRLTELQVDVVTVDAE